MPELDLFTALALLRDARTEAQDNYDKIGNKYEGGGMYSSEDAYEQDYLEGKITAYDHAIQLLEGSTNE